MGKPGRGLSSMDGWAWNLTCCSEEFVVDGVREETEDGVWLERLDAVDEVAAGDGVFLVPGHDLGYRLQNIDPPLRHVAGDKELKLFAWQFVGNKIHLFRGSTEGDVFLIFSGNEPSSKLGCSFQIWL